MRLRDITELAWQRMKARSLRFALTVMGIGAGVGLVFFLVSLGFGLQEVVIGRIVTSESLLSLTVAVNDDADALITITDETIKEFKEVSSVLDVSPLLSAPTEITHGELKAQTLAQAVPPAFFRYAAIEASQGELFGEDDRQGIVVSSSVLRLFDIAPHDALGREFDLTFILNAPEEEGEVTEISDLNIVSVQDPFRIIGTIDTDANTIFVPLRVFDSIENRTYTQARVRVADEESIEGVRRTLLEKGYSVVALTDTLDQLNRIFRVTQITLATLGIVALFIASVGMFNTLTISLLERTREVGILKTIGATNADVWMIFLFEAFVIGLLGGIGGLLAGLGLAQAVNAGVNLLARRFGGEAVDLFATPLWFLITIVLLSLIVGIATGLYPARRAAKLNPLQALKHE